MNEKFPHFDMARKVMTDPSATSPESALRAPAIDELCSRLAEECRTAGSPWLEDHLAGVPDVARPDVLRRLLATMREQGHAAWSSAVREEFLDRLRLLGD